MWTSVALAISLAMDGTTPTVTPRPTWVEPIEAELGATPEHGAPLGAYQLLSDRQVRVESGHVAIYRHMAIKVLESSALGDVSQVEIMVTPGERLTIHAVRLFRDGRWQDAFPTSDLRRFSVEKDAERRIYDGSEEQLVVLHDVRVGDVIDYDFTIESDLAFFGGRYFESFPLAGNYATRRLHARVVLPASHTAAVRSGGGAPAATVRDVGGQREYSWERADLDPVAHDSDTPAWFDPYPRGSISEFGSWGEVASWIAPLMQPGVLDAEVRAKLADIRKSAPDPLSQANQATRFVQDEVRYLGVEIGESGFKPHSPASVMRQRFGDCKDKSLLLVAMLRELGFVADVALTHAHTREHLVDELPSPAAFNHAIVRVTLDGKDHWIDATITHQGGDLRSRVVPEYGYGLVAAASTRELSQIASPASAGATGVTREVYVADATGPGANLDVDTTYLRAAADDARELFAGERLEDIAKRMLDFYAADEPHVVRRGEIELADDRDANRFVVHEHYRIPDYGRDGERRFFASSLATALRTPRTVHRTSPLGVRRAHVRHEIEIRMPDAPLWEDESLRLADDALKFSYSARTDDKSAFASYELETIADVPADQVADHLALRSKIRDRLQGAVRTREAPAAGVEKDAPAGMNIGFWVICGVVAMIAAITRVVRGRRARRGSILSVAKPGDTPEMPIAARDRNAAVPMLDARAQCKHGGSVTEWTELRYGEATLHAAKVRCAECERSATTYFRFRPEDHE